MGKHRKSKLGQISRAGLVFPPSFLWKNAIKSGSPTVNVIIKKRRVGLPKTMSELGVYHLGCNWTTQVLPFLGKAILGEAAMH